MNNMACEIAPPNGISLLNFKLAGRRMEVATLLQQYLLSLIEERGEPLVVKNGSPAKQLQCTSFSAIYSTPRVLLTSVGVTNELDVWAPGIGKVLLLHWDYPDDEPSIATFKRGDWELAVVREAGGNLGGPGA